VRVYGSTTDSIPAMTDPVADGEMFWFPPHNVVEDPKLIVEVWETPCHTKGHVCFVVNEKPLQGLDVGASRGDAARPTPVAIFTGDTLFSGGTGKFFEGSAAEMAKNLERMGTLPNSCKIFCGHEYTLNNYKFAAAVEPDNAVVMERINAARRLRRDRFPTMPTTVGDEMTANPYMRVVTSRAACGKIAMAMYGITGDMVFRDGRTDNVAVLAELRRLRDENLLQVKIEALSQGDS
jgi:hydroxyacylglutathione hydrolase